MRARMQGGVLARNFTEFASLFIAWKISEKPFTRMSVCLLRQDNRGVGSDADVAAAGHPIPADLACRRVVRRMIAEIGAVPFQSLLNLTFHNPSRGNPIV